MTKEKIKIFMEAVRRLRASLPDELALENIYFFPEWKIGDNLIADDRILFEDSLYKVLQDHTSNSDLLPTIAKDYFEKMSFNDSDF